MIDTDGDLSNLREICDVTANDMKVMKQTLQDITTCIGHLQQNRSPQSIPPTNNVNPTNQGNNNTQGRGRGSTGVEGEVNTFIKINLPFAGGARAM